MGNQVIKEKFLSNHDRSSVPKPRSTKSVSLYDIMTVNRKSIAIDEEEFRNMRDTIQRVSIESSSPSAFIM